MEGIPQALLADLAEDLLHEVGPRLGLAQIALLGEINEHLLSAGADERRRGADADASRLERWRRDGFERGGAGFDVLEDLLHSVAGYVVLSSGGLKTGRNRMFDGIYSR